MNKKKIIGLAGAVVVCILVFVFIVIRGKSPNPAENPVEMLGRIENALGDCKFPFAVCPAGWKLSVPWRYDCF